MFEILNISKIYKYKKTEKLVLNNVSFNLPNKGLVSFIGKSGEGKTTLFNLLSCLDKPDCGEIIYDNINLTKLSESKLDSFRAEYVSFLFQDFNLLKDENVINNVKYSANKKDDDEKAMSCLKKVGLEGFECRDLKTLSIGQIQRVALAAAIYRDSKILFCDEPTGNLDTETAYEIADILKKLSESILVCVVTHDEKLAKDYSDVIYKIENSNVKKIFEKNNFNPEFDKSNLKINTPLKLGFKKAIKLSFKNLLNSKILSLITLILLIGQLTLFCSVFSFSSFSKEDVFENTYQTSQRYVLPLTTVVHNKEKNVLGEYIGYRNSLNWDNENLWVSSQNDVLDAKQKYGWNNIVKTYTFAFNLRDFSSKDIDILPFSVGSKGSYDYPSNFYKYHGLENFNSFSIPLLKGSLPKNENDILIFDYMEEGLKHYGIISDGETINQKLKHQIYDLEMNICGVIKSSYKDTIEYLDKVNGSSYVTTSYGSRSDDFDTGNILLSELCNIIGYENFIKKHFNYSNKNIFSYASTDFYDFKEEIKTEINLKAIPKKINLTKEISETIEFEYKKESDSGLILDKKILMDLTGFKNESEFDNYSFGRYKGIEGFIYDLGYKININRIAFSNFPNHYECFADLSDICGVAKYGTLDTCYMLYTEDEYDYRINDKYASLTNLNYYHPSLLLSSDWSSNNNIIDRLIIPFENKDNSFYDTKPADFKEHFYCLHDYLNRIVKGSYRYLEKISTFTNKLMIYLTIGTGIVIFLFSFLAIKNNFYKIGVLKSRGLSNAKTTLLFSLSSILVFLIAFIVSIPLSFALVSKSDAIFTETIIGGVTFFKVTGISMSVSFLTGLGLLIIGIAIPLISLFVLKPIEMIRRNK